MRKIIPHLLAVLAVLNLVWLFVFNYQMPSFFKSFTARGEQSTEQEALSPAEEEEAQAPETSEEGTEAVEAPVQEAGQPEPDQQEAAGGQAAAVQASVESAEETTAPEGENAAQTGETVAAEGERTCHPSDGNTPNIRTGPGGNYEVLRMAAYDEVMIVRGEEEDGWLPIRTKDGLEGYIFAGMLVIDENAQ